MALNTSRDEAITFLWARTGLHGSSSGRSITGAQLGCSITPHRAPTSTAAREGDFLVSIHPLTLLSVTSPPQNEAVFSCLGSRLGCTSSCIPGPPPAYAVGVAFLLLLPSLLHKHFMQIQSLLAGSRCAAEGWGRGGEGKGWGGGGKRMEPCSLSAAQKSRAETRLMMLSGYKISSL